MPPLDPETEQLERSLEGRYRLEGELGRGGMAVVYLAHDLKHDRPVAIKVLKPEIVTSVGRNRFLREIEVAARLNHPHIVPLFDSGEANGSIYYVMPRVEGESLRTRLARGRIPLSDVLRLTQEIAEALDHAHRRGLIHRDVKPDNILLAEGIAMVADFGIARVTQETGADGMAAHTRTTSGTIIGTPAYMAPEQCAGSSSLDGRADLYSLGCVVYEMLAGEPPFTAPDAWALMARHAQDPVPPLDARNESVPPSMARVIEKALAKKPADRFPGILGFAQALLLAAGNGSEGGKSLEDRSQGNLPVPRTSFIGRAEELARCRKELESNRLVTLTGIGGCGKTRLALQVAGQVRGTYSGGAWWVDLAPISDAARVDEAVAAALGILNPQRSPREAILEFVRNRELLLVLDNCEHLHSASGELTDALLGSAEKIRILTTSREGLGVEGERILAVQSLSMPPRGSAIDVQAIAGSDAVRLFSERAAAVQPGFAVTESNASTILEICRRLDGIPLAIELAAARARLLSLQQIRDRLEDRLALLTGRGKALPRHQTLRATLQWSYDLLTPQEQRMLRSLSVFHGGWTLSAATAVCGESAEGSETLDLLGLLIEKSLVEVVTTEGAEARYRLLEMVRQFAFDALVAASEASDAQTSHALHYLEMFERLIPQLLGPGEVEAAASLERDLDNLLSALEESGHLPGGTERAMRAAADGWLIWVARGHIAIGRDMLDGLLERQPKAEAIGRAKALMLSSMLARFAGDAERALADAEASVALHERLGGGDSAGLAFSLFQRAGARLMFKDADRGASRSDLVRGAALSRRARYHLGESWCVNMLGIIAQDDGDVASAEARYREALSLALESGSPYLQILYRANIGSLCAEQSRWPESVEAVLSAIRLLQNSANRHFGPTCVLTTALIAGGFGDLSGAVRLVGAAEAMYAEIGEAGWVKETVRQLAGLGAQPGSDEYVRSYAEGQRLGFNAAIAEAVDALQRYSSRTTAPGRMKD